MIMAVNVCLILFFNNFKYGCNKICEEAQKNQVVRTAAAISWSLPSDNQIPSRFPSDALSLCPLLWYWSLPLSIMLSACSRSPNSLDYSFCRVSSLFPPFLGPKQKQQKAVFSQLFTTFPFPAKPFLSPAAAKRCPRTSGCSITSLLATSTSKHY